MIETVIERSNYPPQALSFFTNDSLKKDRRKHFKVFSNLEQYLSSIEEIRLVDELMKPTKKN